MIPPGLLHSLGGRERPDHRHRRMGPRRGLPPGARLARRRLPADSRWRSTSRRAISAWRISARASATRSPSTTIDPRTLELEITEGAMMHDVCHVRARPASASRTSACACRSTTSAPAIPRSPTCHVFRSTSSRSTSRFVSDIISNPANAAITQAIIAMSHKLGKITLAEGVETEEQMQYLRRNDCDEMQGYFFSRPLPADELAALRSAGKRLALAQRHGGCACRPCCWSTTSRAFFRRSTACLRREGYRVLLADSASTAFRRPGARSPSR
jgi:predicted signal transduction protein with EAL and GGDEF domain